jgi:DNA-binding transcriptional MerR regulator
MPARYTISQLAHTADVPASTVRYYQRVGLLQPEGRSEGNYRLYGGEALRRLKFIRAAQAIGFTLDDVKALLGREDEEPPPCRDVQTLIERRLADIEERLQDLRHVRRVLKSSLEKCRRTEQAGCCHVLETLRQA